MEEVLLVWVVFIIVGIEGLLVIEGDTIVRVKRVCVNHLSVGVK